MLRPEVDGTLESKNSLTYLFSHVMCVCVCVCVCVRARDPSESTMFTMGVLQLWLSVRLLLHVPELHILFV